MLVNTLCLVNSLSFCALCDCRYGEVVNINLVREKSSGKSKGFCFLCYEDQRSTILAVDNLNGAKVCKVILVFSNLLSVL